MEDILLIELHYLPLTSYFDLLKDYPKVLIEACEPFQKQSLRNRTNILTANGVQMLSVPVLKNSQMVKDIKIDYSQTWMRDHLRAITSAYKHAPYFDYCFPYYEEIYNNRKSFLFDLNLEILHLTLKILRWNIEIKVTDSYVKEYTQYNIKDSRLKYTKNIHESNISHFQKYTQLFTNQFVNNLSIVDFIFNKGF